MLNSTTKKVLASVGIGLIAGGVYECLSKATKKIITTVINKKSQNLN